MGRALPTLDLGVSNGGVVQPSIWDAGPGSASSPSDGPVHSGETETIARHGNFLQYEPIGQWFAKYVIVQNGRELILIDQHAAHERLYYEALLGKWNDVTKAQPLLVPWSTTLSAELWEIWEEHALQLRGWGFEIDSLGGRTLAVRAIPFGLGDEESRNGPNLLIRLLEALEQGRFVEGHPLRDLSSQAAAMAACKAAIKAFRPLARGEIGALLQQMSQAENPYACPHGRPTLLKLGIEEVDRRFGRHP